MNFYIEFSDSTFFDQFSQPTKWSSPIEGEVWTLYAGEKYIDEKKAKIMVGWIDETPGLLAETPASSEVNIALVQEAEKIASQLALESGQLVSAGIKSKVDGFQVVDAETGKVIDWGGSIPAYLPEDADQPKLLYMDELNNIYLIKDEVQGDVRAISLVSIGNLNWLLAAGLLTILTIFLLSYIGGSTVLKKWILLYRKNIPSINEALRVGESQELEFKRGLVDDEILRSIAAFANTNDGVIFIGIDDKAHLVGIDASTPRKRERVVNKIFSLVRNRIRPSLALSISFEKIREFFVLKLYIPRGDEPLYYLDSLIFIRHGDADVKAKPELVKKALADFAF